MTGAAGHIADMNKRMAQNRALLGKRRTFKKINDLYGKNAHLAQSEEDKERFTREQIEWAKQKYRVEAKKERDVRFAIICMSMAITILLMLGFFLS